MSEFLDNASRRKEMLKHLLLRIHEGDNPEVLKKQLIGVLQDIPYYDVVEVEQELIGENVLSEAEILEFCDIHAAVLEGNIDKTGEKEVPAGHPIDTFKQENKALKKEIQQFETLWKSMYNHKDTELPALILQLRTLLNNLWDVDKHYKRKEYLLFPYLEKHLITGPPKVMWGKHDEIRELLKVATNALKEIDSLATLKSVVQLSVIPAIEMLDSMIMKEEDILFPMSMDTLTDEEWYKVYKETGDFGYCLFDPEAEWEPQNVVVEKQEYISTDAIRLSSGNFNIAELEALFIHLPIDITFVDKEDKVRFFSHSPKRVFERNRSIIGRDVRMCHPPGSVHIVEQILEDFRSGKENKAVFWLSNFMGRFIYIEYSALRGKDGEYLGVVEVTQDITEMRKLEGDQRLLSYTQK